MPHVARPWPASSVSEAGGGTSVSSMTWRCVSEQLTSETDLWAIGRVPCPVCTGRAVDGVLIGTASVWSRLAETVGKTDEARAAAWRNGLVGEAWAATGLDAVRIEAIPGVVFVASALGCGKCREQESTSARPRRYPHDDC